MMKRLAIFGVIIIMSFGLFAGCGPEKNFVIVRDEAGTFGFKDTEDGGEMFKLAMISSLQELKDLCDEWNNPAFDENSEYYHSDEFLKEIRSYDEAYFSEKFLIIYSFWRGHDKEIRIDSIERDGSTLIVNASYKRNRGAHTLEAFNWLMIIEVKKADVDITDVTAVEVRHK